MLNLQTIRTTRKGEIIYEVLNVFRTSPPQTHPATIQGHINKGTDCCSYRNDFEMQVFRRKHHILLCPFVPNYNSES